MGPSKLLAVLTAALVLSATLTIGQEQGPLKDPGATVSRPRKPADADKNPDTDLPKIPSRLKKDPAKETGDLTVFKSDVDVVTLDVAVVDNKGHFIPSIPGAYFRVLEDNVPQQISNVTMGEAPLTIAMVIE